jgi:hypothetical protein
MRVSEPNLIVRERETQKSMRSVGCLLLLLLLLHELLDTLQTVPRVVLLLSFDLLANGDCS